MASDENHVAKVTAKSLVGYLGKPRFRFGVAERADEVGVATGLAWTEFGGDVLFIEATLMKGRGTLLLTGHLGDVMQESGKAAMTLRPHPGRPTRD